jgi:carboxymethylenebutenolidase
MPDLEIAGLPAHIQTPPVGDGPWPGVVVLHELFGLNDDIREHTARLAAAGYLAVAPDLFRGLGFRRCIVATFKALRAEQGRPFEDIDAVRRALAEREDCTGKVGVIGFCMGGGFALLTAARGFDVAAPNYSPLPKDLDRALTGACPIVASFGARDPELRGAAPKVKAALERAGVEHDIKEYPDSGHAFMSRLNTGPLNPVLRVAGLGFHQPSAEDAWRRILRFFDAHLRDRP